IISRWFLGEGSPWNAPGSFEGSLRPQGAFCVSPWGRLDARATCIQFPEPSRRRSIRSSAPLGRPIGLTSCRVSPSDFKVRQIKRGVCSSRRSNTLARMPLRPRIASPFVDRLAQAFRAVDRGTHLPQRFQRADIVDAIFAVDTVPQVGALLTYFARR